MSERPKKITEKMFKKSCFYAKMDYSKLHRCSHECREHPFVMGLMWCCTITSFPLKKELFLEQSERLLNFRAIKVFEHDKYPNDYILLFWNPCRFQGSQICILKNCLPEICQRGMGPLKFSVLPKVCPHSDKADLIFEELKPVKGKLYARL